MPGIADPDTGPNLNGSGKRLLTLKEEPDASPKDLGVSPAVACTAFKGRGGRAVQPSDDSWCATTWPRRLRTTLACKRPQITAARGSRSCSGHAIRKVVQVRFQALACFHICASSGLSNLLCHVSMRRSWQAKACLALANGS